MNPSFIERLDTALEKMLSNQPIESAEEAAAKPPAWASRPELAALWEKFRLLQFMHSELQQFSIGLANGELAVTPPSRRNYLASGLKQLQMHLRHLTWQSQCVAEGDYSQRVDFMGEFAEAFNKMTALLADREAYILAQRETMLRVFNQIEPIFVVSEADPNQVLYANKMAEQRFRLAEDQELSRAWLRQVHTQCPPETERKIQDVTDERWYRISCEHFFWDHQMDSRLYHCMDITDHVRRETDLEYAANTDALTGLNNRLAFDRFFAEYWDTCAKNRSPLSLLMFDIDFFKKCNDRYGHLMGDKCLAAFACIMRANIGRFNDVIARFGGEEFVVLLPYTNQDAAVHVAETVRRATEEAVIPLPEGGEGIKITVSGGVASCVPSCFAAREEFLAAADQALYAAKQTGRNRIRHAGDQN